MRSLSANLGAGVLGGVGWRDAWGLRNCLTVSRNGEPEAVMAAPMVRTERISTNEAWKIERGFLILLKRSSPPKADLYPLQTHKSPTQLHRALNG